jgi:carbon storage regulator CsrA
MLVLTRGAGESIRLVLPGGGVVVVKVDSVHRGQVKLSFDAPDDVEILRTELAEIHTSRCDQETSETILTAEGMVNEFRCPHWSYPLRYEPVAETVEEE